MLPRVSDARSPNPAWKRRIVLITIVICFAISVVAASCTFWSSYQKRASAAYFERQLSLTGFHDQIRIGDNMYQVAGSDVTDGAGKTVTDDGERFLILQTAYALSIALRAPLLGIEGTNPERLRNSVEELRAAQNELADQQVSKEDSQMVRDSLYPIRFLRSLADLEVSRQNFLRTHSLKDNWSYQNEVSASLRAAMEDISAFESSMSLVLKDEPDASIFTLGGIIPITNFLPAISAIEQRMEEVKTVQTNRRKCLQGSVGSCEQVFLPDPEERRPEASRKIRTENPIVKAEMLRILREAEADVFVDRQQYILAESACMDNFPGPHRFLVRYPSDPENPISVTAIDDLFFTVASEENTSPTSTLGYLKTDYGITYSLVNPMYFYVCPESQRDIGTIFAMEYVAELAKRYPDLAREFRMPLTEPGAPRFELDAKAYVRAAAAEETSKNITSDLSREVLSAGRMLTERSARLDEYVRRVAQTDERNAALHKNGVPYDVSARSLFLTHSAFPSLFLAHNDSAGASKVTLHERTGWSSDAIPLPYAAYSRLRDKVPQSEIIRNLHATIEFHAQRGPDAE